ncbi:MAG: hypothetical protein M1840_006236 [Geoglossum simile]|nr:MAG: hypothetical protein M1840_006236 [Geoglossum simile]
MASTPDLSHAISLHPHPFSLHPSRSGTSTPGRDCISHNPLSFVHSHRSGTPIPAREGSGGGLAIATGLEPVPPLPDEHDAVSRHVAHSIPRNDVENQRPPRYSSESDPYQLSSRLKSSSEINLIRANTSRKRGAWGPLATRNKKAKKIQGFYESQNTNIQRLLTSVDEHRREAKNTHVGTQLKYKIAVNGSFAANLLLAALQVYGAVSSGSLSLFTTMADALFDPLSNAMLILSNRAVNRVDPRQYPSGKARIETAGNIVFCFFMCSVSFTLIVMSARDLAVGSSNERAHFHLASVIAVAIAFITKLCLFLYCWTLRDVYSQIRILWEDHRNDLFINGFGLLTSIGGSKLKWWIDPMGAIILSCLIVGLWLRTAYSEFQLLIGVTADPQMLQWITYIGSLLPF